MFEKTIDFLMENACINIKYMIHRDMMGESIDKPSMKKMQEEVLQSTMVQNCLKSQHPDGWLGHGLHCVDGMDNLINVLLRLGVEPDSRCIQKAINALLTPEIASQHKNHFPAGDSLDADGRGGNKSITAWILSTVGISEETELLADEIRLSFSHLSCALEHKCIDDFTIKGLKFRYYKPKIKFPGANHIGILANTNSWKNDENIRTAKIAMAHCYSIMKDIEGNIMFLKPKEFGTNYMGPFNYDWKTLNPINISNLQGMINNQKNRFQFGFWLRSMTRHPFWGLQTTQPYEFLAELLENDTLMDIMTDKSLSGFRHILGVEPNWRNKKSVKCDLEFAVLKACWPVLTKQS